MWLPTDDVIWTGSLLLATLLQTISGASTDVVRCYCNDATCVTTGYICKSSLGFCYTAIPAQLAVMSSSSSRHSQTNSSWFSASRGCVNEDMLSTCTRGGGVAGEGNQPHLVCCQRDMCNYPDGSLQRVRASPGADEGLSGAESDYSNSASTTSPWTSFHDVSSTETWIRAALIAVPLTGLVILIVLVLIAARMLSRDVHTCDRRRHRQRWSDHISTDSRRIISISGISPVVHAGCFINGSLDEKTPSIASEQLLYGVAGRHVTTGYDVVNFYSDDVSDKLVNYHM